MKFLTFLSSNPNNNYVFNSQQDLAEHFDVSARTIRQNLIEGKRGKWAVEKHTNEAFATMDKSRFAKRPAKPLTTIKPLIEADEVPIDEVISNVELDVIMRTLFKNVPRREAHTLEDLIKIFTHERQKYYAHVYLLKINLEIGRLEQIGKTVDDSDVRRLLEEMIAHVMFEIELTAPEMIKYRSGN